MRECFTCKQEKPLTEFYSHTQKPSGLSIYCKPCHNERASRNRKRRKQENPEREAEKQLRWQIKALYGLEWGEYQRMQEEQGGVCAICGSLPSEAKQRLQVDHCHETGRVRGLLCWNCNTALGKFYDNVDYLRKAVSYLELSKYSASG